MGTASNWYENDDRLLAELRETPAVAARTLGIAAYETLEELARGGQGVIYRARQRSTGQIVALKVLLDGAFASPTGKRRFEREIDVIAGLRHPNIVRVYDSGLTADGRPFCVMEFIEGKSLDQAILDFGFWILDCSPSRPPVPFDNCSPSREARETAPPVQQSKIQNPKSKIASVMQLFAKICDAVHYAHQRGVIHRDLKPSNIRVDVHGEPRVLDFGLAKELAAGGGPVQTQMSIAGTFVGSLPWASPEQAHGDPDQIDIRTDVYSLGVILYQVLTGRFPYDVSSTLSDVLINIKNAPPVAPRRLRPDLDDDLETIALKCLAKEPDRRYQTAGELAADVRRYLTGEPLDAKRDSTWYVLRRTLRRYRVIAGFSAALLLLSLGTTVAVSILYGQTLQSRDAASAAKVKAESQAERAGQVQKFLERMLSSVAPQTARGADTALLRSMLDDAAKRIDSELKDQPESAAALHDTIGATYSAISDHVTGLAHRRRALELYREALGENDERTLMVRVRIVGTLLQNEQLEEAEALARPLIQDLRRVLGENHRATLEAMHDYAMIRALRGGLDEAEPIAARIAEAFAETKGADNPDTLTALSDLAVTKAELGKYAEARELHEKVLAARRRVHGDDHPDVCVSLNLLALVREYLDDLPGAEGDLRECIDRSMKVCGPEHSTTLIAKDNLARIVQARGRLDEAETLFREVLAIRQRALPPDHPATLTTMNNLADVVINRGQLDEGVELQREALAGTRRSSGNDTMDTAICANNLARTLKRLGQPAQAEELFREAVATAQRVLPPDNFQIGLLRSNYGRFLVESKRYDEAEPQLREGYAVLSATWGAEHPRCKSIRAAMADLYEAMQKPDEAARWRE